MEVRTQPVEAQVLGREQFRAENIPGSFYIAGEDSEDDQLLTYRCPCGCGGARCLTIGDGYKPAETPSWNWNGSLSKPTLTPSVHWTDHWHGWLTDGTWRSV